MVRSDQSYWYVPTFLSDAGMAKDQRNDAADLHAKLAAASQTRRNSARQPERPIHRPLIHDCRFGPCCIRLPDPGKRTGLAMVGCLPNALSPRGEVVEWRA